jgi:hypothetical protein
MTKHSAPPLPQLARRRHVPATRSLLTGWRLPLLSIALLAVQASATNFGNPSGFLTKESIRQTRLHPAVVWQELTGEFENRPMYIHVVTVDLSHPQLTLRALQGQRFVSPPNQYFRRSIVSQLQRDNNALVAINTAFFDIGATQTPFGLLVADQKLIRTPATNRSVLAFSDDKEVYIGNFTTTVLSSYQQTAPLVSGVNNNAITANQLHVYMQPWDRSPGNTAAFANGLPLTEVIVEKTGFVAATAQSPLWRQQGRVVAVRDEMAPVTIAANQYVLTGSGTTRDYLKSMQPGEDIDLLWRFAAGPTGLATHKLESVIAGSSLLVVNGAVRSANTDHWNTRHPRSAVGVAADRKRIVLVLVEGRLTGKAEGMSLHTVAAFLRHMGVVNGLEFDGGGSSALAGRVDGSNRLLSQPSDGSERYVPVGLGIHVVTEPNNPFFFDVRSAASDREAVVNWQTVLPAVSYAVQLWPNAQAPTAHPAVAANQHSAHLISSTPASDGWLVRLVANHAGGVEQSAPIAVARGTATTGSGVPNWWLSHHFGSNQPPLNADPDGDGVSVADEYFWGTDPLNPLSQPNFELKMGNHANYQLTFSPHRSDRVYQVFSHQGSPAASGSISSLAPSPNVAEGSASFTLQLPDQATFHQLRVTLPD